MLLKNKIAVIYGGGGAVGGAVAEAFAREGARVFLAGRTLSKLEAVAKKISDAGGVVEIATVNAHDKKEIDHHLAGVFSKTGSIDISFNLISLDDLHGIPLAEMECRYFVAPITNAMNTHFLTALAAVHYMAKKKSGIVLALTANAGRVPYAASGGFGVACAAIEGFCRQLAVEAGSKGVRIVCIRSAGSPDAPGVSEAFNRHAANAGQSREEFEYNFAKKTML